MDLGLLKVLFEIDRNATLNLDEAKYAMQILLTIMGSPWRFDIERAKENYDIYYGEDSNVAAAIQIVPSKILKRPFEPPRKVTRCESLAFFMFSESKQQEPIYEKIGEKSVFRNDILLSTFYFLQGLIEHKSLCDHHGRPLAKGSVRWEEDLLFTPIINQYADFFQKKFKPTHSFLPLWPNGKQYACAVTHDVDYPQMVRTIECMRYAFGRKKIDLTKICDILCGKETFWCFEKWIELEKAKNFRSAFYFCGFKGNLLRYLLKAPDPFYDICTRQFREIVHILSSEGFEIGMHASYEAYKSPERFKKEKIRLEEVLGSSIHGNRHHYWNWNHQNPLETILIQQNIGLNYDASAAFPDHGGFRCGLSVPFPFYDSVRRSPTELIELPTTLMDDHLFKYFGNSKEKDQESYIHKLLQGIKSSGGILVLDFHQRILNSTFYPGWAEMFWKIMDQFVDEKCYIDLPHHIADHWKRRLKTLRMNSQ